MGEFLLDWHFRFLADSLFRQVSVWVYDVCVASLQPKKVISSHTILRIPIHIRLLMRQNDSTATNCERVNEVVRRAQQLCPKVTGACSSWSVQNEMYQLCFQSQVYVWSVSDKHKVFLRRLVTTVQKHSHATVCHTFRESYNFHVKLFTSWYYRDAVWPGRPEHILPPPKQRLQFKKWDHTLNTHWFVRLPRTLALFQPQSTTWWCSSQFCHHRFMCLNVSRMKWQLWEHASLTTQLLLQERLTIECV